jgi:hypothetical protein
VYVGLFVPTGVEPTYHWYDGVVPPLVGVAVNVTLVPAQIGEGTSSVIDTLTEEMLFTVIVITLLADVAVVGHGRLLVIITIITSPSLSVDVVYVGPLPPTTVELRIHW